MTSLNIRIPEQVAERLDFLAHETGRTKSYYVREAIEEKLEELEDYYLALQSLENVNSGKSRTWTQEELEQDRDLED
jgi:RHH-type rel operon transcriptional repressor/antitoxin RelB